MWLWDLAKEAMVIATLINLYPCGLLTPEAVIRRCNQSVIVLTVGRDNQV